MKYFVAIILIFVIFLAIKGLLERTNLHNKIAQRIKKLPYSKLIFGLLLIIWAFSAELLIYFLNQKFNQQNFASLIVRAIYTSIIYEFGAPFLEKEKS